MQTRGKTGKEIRYRRWVHGSHEEHERVIEVLRAATAELGQPVRIMGDLQGPKILLKSIKGDSDEPGGRERAAFDNPGVMEDILQGAAILLNDGEVKLEVTDKHLQRITTRVIVCGTIGSRKGVNLPGTKVHLPAITEKDKQDLQFLRCKAQES